MRRDEDYLRQLLFEIEEQDDWRVFVLETPSESVEEKKRHYHVRLLCDAALMVQESKAAYRMTHQGHDFLDAIRSDTVWKKTKEGATAVGGMTLGLMKDLAIAYVKQEAAEKLGINL